MPKCDNCGLETKDLLSPYWLDSLLATSKLCKQCAIDFSSTNHTKPQRSPEEIKKVRIEAMKKAREARMKKLAERKQNVAVKDR